MRILRVKEFKFREILRPLMNDQSEYVEVRRIAMDMCARTHTHTHTHCNVHVHTHTQICVYTHMQTLACMLYVPVIQMHTRMCTVWQPCSVWLAYLQNCLNA